jgi:hypothetical protein
MFQTTSTHKDEISFSSFVSASVKNISTIFNAFDYHRNFFNIVKGIDASQLMTQEPFNTTSIKKLLYVENFKNFKTVNIKESSHFISQFSIVINVYKCQ